MGNIKGICEKVFTLFWLCLVIQAIVGPCGLASGSKIFQPIAMEFPDTERTGVAAIEYKTMKLAPLSSGARKEDPNMQMTGKSCARGLGSLYEV